MINRDHLPQLDMRSTWRWYIVVDNNGNCSEVFNSEHGADGYVEEWGGTIIPVKEVKS